MLRRVGLPDAARRMRAYPHELSGGMRQRVVIAMGPSHGTRCNYCREPTTALDVTVQAQIPQTAKELSAKPQHGDPIGYPRPRGYSRNV